MSCTPLRADRGTAGEAPVDGPVDGAVDGAAVGAVDGAAVGAVDGAAVGHLELAPDPRAAREARRLVTALCERVGVDEDIADTAVLLTSEVVTNAVIHGRSRTRLSVAVSPVEVVVEVGDDNSRPPVLRTHDDDALDGRGITLLEAVAARWGVRQEGIGKVVWFVVDGSAPGL